MKAAVLNEIPGDLNIEDIDIDEPGPREVLIETKAAGLCHSDLRFMEGAYEHDCPTVLGHESAGVVLAVGSQVTYVEPGDSVITCLSAFCGYCEQCLSGHMVLCENKNSHLVRGAEQPSRLSRNGEPVASFLHLSSFAEQMLVHEHTIVKMPEEMPYDRAALIGCGVTTGLGAVFRTARVEPGSTVAVIGMGGVGLAAVQGARIAGANKIIAVDTVEEKLELAKSLGATAGVNAAETDAVARVLELTGGRGVHNSIEAVGTSRTAEQAFRMLASGGQATVIGLIPDGVKVSIEGAELVMEKTLTGSNMGSNQFRTDMPRFVDMYLDGRLKLDEMISNHISLEDVNQGFDQMREGGIARNVILF